MLLQAMIEACQVARETWARSATSPLTATLTVTAQREYETFLSLDCEIVNQHGQAVVSSEAVIMAPTEKRQVDLPELPAITSAP